MKFTLDKTPDIKAELAIALRQVADARKSLSTRHGQPKHGTDFFISLAELLRATSALVENSRRIQKAKDRGSKELCAIVDRAFNSVNGARQAQDHGTVLSGDEIEEIRADLNKFDKEFRHQSISLTMAATESNPDEMEEEAAAAYESAASADRLDRIYDKIKDMLGGYAKFSPELPNANTVKYKDKNIVMLRLPVLAVFSSFNQDALKRIGLKVNVVLEYPIIEEQMILAVNVKAVEKNDIDQDVLVDTALQQYSKRIGVKMSKAYDTPSVGRNGFVYYWLMPERQLTGLLRATNGGVDGWGLPFRA